MSADPRFLIEPAEEENIVPPVPKKDEELENASSSDTTPLASMSRMFSLTLLAYGEYRTAPKPGLEVVQRLYILREDSVMSIVEAVPTRDSVVSSISCPHSRRRST